MSGRVAWLVADAVPYGVARRLLDEGRLPALAALARDGTMRPTRPPAPNCQTPPSLATLFSGAPPRRHGITGFELPAAGDPGASTPAFAVRPAAELLWEAAGAAGLTTVLVHAPWALGDGDGDVPPGCALALAGFSGRRFRGDAQPLAHRRELELAGSPALAALDGASATLECRATGRRLALALDGPWRTWQPPAAPALRVRAVHAGGRPTLLHTGSWRVSAGPGREALELARRCGPFVGEGLTRAYRSGRLGARLVDGGDGGAELLFVDTVREAAEYFRRCAAAALAARPDADLVVMYQPCFDDVGHEVAGWCDESSAAYRPQVADAARRMLRAACELVDAQLADVCARCPGWTVALASDHGMAGVSHVVHVDQALHAAGLAAFRDDGSLDLERTAVALAPAGDGSLIVRPEALAEAGAAPADALARAELALGALVEPATGRRVVEGLAPREGGGAWLVLAPGFHPVRGPAAGGVLSVAEKSGSHLLNTGEPSLHGVFAARGPGIARDPGAEPIDSAGVAPVLARALGLARAERTPQAVAG